MVILERQQGEINKMTQHIYRVLEIVGGEKSITFKILYNQSSAEVSLFMFGFKIIKSNKSQVNIYRIVSLYMVTQRLKIFLLNNFKL